MCKNEERQAMSTGPLSYLLGFKSGGGHGGTDSSLMIQLYDDRGGPIGDEFEVTDRLHDVTGNALQSGTYQIANFEVPLSGAVDGHPDVYFIEATIKGSDMWHCDYILAAPTHPDWCAGWSDEDVRKSLGKKEIAFTSAQSVLNGSYTHKPEAKFSFGADFSTDSHGTEGKPSYKISRDGFKPKTIGGPTPSSRTLKCYSITEAYGDSESKTPGEVVATLRQKTVSVGESEHNEQDNSLSIGITAGYSSGNEPGGNVSTTISYGHIWKNWRDKQGSEELLTKTSQTVSFESLSVPAYTVTIMEYMIYYTVTEITVSDGCGKTSKINLIRAQSFTTGDSIRHDFTKSTKKTSAEEKKRSLDEWNQLKNTILLDNPEMKDRLENAEKRMREAEWFA